jgi:hypothetical protein
MAKRSRKTVSIRIKKDGSFVLKSTGGVDLRKIVPSLFTADATDAGAKSNAGSHVYVAGRGLEYRPRKDEA